MERTTEDRSLTAIAERAAEWFVAYRDTRLTGAERSEFVAWLQASPLHVREYLSVAAVAQALGEAPALADAELAELLSTVAAESGKASNVVSLNTHRPQSLVALPESRRHWLVGLVACLVVALGLLVMTRWPEWRGATAEQYQVAGEGTGVWRLSDGSMLHLNAHSAVRVRFSSAERLVELQRGQALFEVSHHSPLKFRVVAGFADVTAVGTRFEVRRDAEANQVTVVEGSVSVVSNTAPAHTVALNAGQRMRVKADGSVTQPERSDSSQVFAWVQHQMEFEQQPLASVIQQINQYALTPISIADPTLAQLPISGVFNAYDVESFIEFLRRLPGVAVMSTSDRVQVVRRADLNQSV